MIRVMLFQSIVRLGNCINAAPRHHPLLQGSEKEKSYAAMASCCAVRCLKLEADLIFEQGKRFTRPWRVLDLL